MSDGFKGRTLKRKNVKGLALSAPQPKSLGPSAGDAQIPGAIGNEYDRPDTLEIGMEFKLDLRSEDLIVVKELGAGNGGTVSKVFHAATRVVMAKKVIHVEAKTAVRKQIVRELHIMHDCNSPNIVSFYGAFLNDAGDVIMCMEYMDCGSLDRISKDFGPVRVDVLGKIAEGVLGGLNYIYEVHRIMHRDIKPSNVLVNSRGDIKLCDFGVSGELVNSVANTFVGTSTYMAPERIQGAAYSIKSDVWSVGLTLMELAIGKFPFDSSDSTAGDRASAYPTGILDLLQQIVHEPAPKLPKSDAFPPILDQMIQKCLLKDPEKRPTPRELYDKDHFLQAAKRTPVNLQEWAVSMLERHNRKSHLAPQLSPSTKALLRDGSGSTTSTSSPSKGSRTPTSAEIPIATDEGRALSPPLQTSIRHPVSKQQPPDSHYGRPGPSDTTTTYDAADVNGSRGMQQYEEPQQQQQQQQQQQPRPTFPPRTSSSSAMSGHPRAGGSLGMQTTTLPIRPAPPPSGPLPPPPSSSLGRSHQHGSSRRQGMAGLLYSNGDTPQH